MTERDDVPRISEAERQRAHAVHSIDDETRMHAGGDETDLAQGAGGDLRRPEASDQGGDLLDDSEAGEDAAGEGDGERAGSDMLGGGALDSPDTADADLAQEGSESA